MCTDVPSSLRNENPLPSFSWGRRGRLYTGYKDRVWELNEKGKFVEAGASVHTHRAVLKWRQGQCSNKLSVLALVEFFVLQIKNPSLYFDVFPGCRLLRLPVHWNSIKAISSSKFSSLELVGLQHFVGRKKEILKNSWRSRKWKNHFTFLSRTSQNRLTEECNKKQPLFSCNFICHAVACCHFTSKFRGFQCSCILLAGVCAREKHPTFHAIFSHIDSSSYKTNVHNTEKNGDVSLFCTLCKQQNVRLLQTFEVLINFCYAISL